MSASIWPPSRVRWLFKLSITALLVALAQPANAFYTRGCNAEYVITTSSFDGNTVRRSFRGEGVHPYGPNGARRHAHRIIRQCVNDHWRERESSSGSILCDEDSRVFGYPFNNLMAEVTEAVCEANPNRPLIDVNLRVLYTGDTGCTGENNMWNQEVARDVRLECGAQRVELGTDRPGEDYENFDLPGGNWQACQSRCEADGRCEAWTFVYPRVGVLPQCWLKDEVPQAHINDCCVSGVAP